MIVNDTAYWNSYRGPYSDSGRPVSEGIQAYLALLRQHDIPRLAVDLLYIDVGTEDALVLIGWVRRCSEIQQAVCPPHVAALLNDKETLQKEIEGHGNDRLA